MQPMSPDVRAMAARYSDPCRFSCGRPSAVGDHLCALCRGWSLLPRPSGRTAAHAKRLGQKPPPSPWVTPPPTLGEALAARRGHDERFAESPRP
jgi:hypothetical protein